MVRLRWSSDWPSWSLCCCSSGRGLARTGRLVTSAALILFFAFASLAATPGTEVKIFATALGLGILLDATIVRAMLAPALIVLFGRWNWWLPRWLARALLIRPAHIRPGASTADLLPSNER